MMNTFSLLSLLLTVQAHPAELVPRSTPVLMGAATSFAVLGVTSINSVSTTVVTGRCGTCPGVSIVGFGPGICTGGLYPNTAPACAAEAACVAAYSAAMALTPTVALGSSLLDGLVLAPGVYTFPTVSAGLSALATVTMNGATNPNGQFIFKITRDFNVGEWAKVVLVNGAQACNVYFVVGGMVNISVYAAMNGNILAKNTIVAKQGTSNAGTWCSFGATVSLTQNALVAQNVCYT